MLHLFEDFKKYSVIYTPSRKLRVYQAQQKSETLGQFKTLFFYLLLSHNTGLQNLTNMIVKKNATL